MKPDRRSLLLCAALLGAVASPLPLGPLQASAIKLVPIPALPPVQPAPPTSPASPPEILPEIPPVQPGLPAPLTPSTPTTPTSTSTPSVPGMAYLPRDPLWPQQWSFHAVHIPEAWKLSRGGPVTVAVLDTGYMNSPELTGRVVNGYDFVSDRARSGDGNGRDPDASGVGPYAYHSEVIANIIAAGHDAQGMAGINPQAKIVHVRVAGTDGMIEVGDLIDGMKWAAGLPVPGVPSNPNPARLLNLSLYADFIPLTGCDPRVQAAVDAVTARGALVVVGAANDGADASGYSPAGCRNVLTVTSVSSSGQRPAYANWGRSVTLAAPGGEDGHSIVASSTRHPGELGAGTSFSAPHVTGVASLLLAARPKLTPATLRSYLTRSATPYTTLAPTGRCDPNPAHTCGAGLLNAEAALNLALASSLGK